MARLISTNIEGTLNVTGKTTLKDLSATNISGNGTLITNIQWNNIDNKTNVIAGNGLIGGGNLGADITLNIESANDGISVNPDSIQLNSVDNLTTDSATQPLSARQGKNLQDTKVAKATKVNVGGGLTGGGSLDKDITITHPGSASSVIERIPNVVTGVSFSNGHVNSIKTYNLDDRYYTETEIDNKFSEINSGLDWKPSVPTYNDILSTYPNPQDGWTVNVNDTDYTYRFTGTEWVSISANSIPLATASVDGKMSKAYASKLDGIAQGANRYVHPNHTGDVTSSGDGATSIVDGKVTNAKLATVSQNTIKGRASANTGIVEDLTPAQVRTMINVSNGAEVNQPAFSMIKIGAKQALAVSKTDVMEFVAGSNIQLSLDETTKKITITNAYAYTHPVFDAPKFTQSTNTTSANILYSVTTNNGHVTGGTYKTITPGSNITVETNIAGEIKINNTYKYTHPTGDGNLHVPATGTENNEKFLMAGASAGELLWQAPPLATSIKPGYLKQLTGSTTEFMRADGTWAVPPSVTYNEYIGTFAGLVPNGNSLSSQDKTSKFLRGDGTWQTPYTLPQATSSVLGGVKIGQGINVSAGAISVPNATTSSNGLMISADKLKLDGIETGANKYVHPTVSRNNTTSSTKPAAGGTFTAIDGVTTNAQGHITGINTKTITMPVADKYVLPPATKTTLGGVIVGDRINVDAAGKISIANYEPAFTKNSGFNKNFGTSSGTVAEGNHTHQNIISRGNVTCETGVTARPAVSGLSMSQVYNNGYPTSYGNVMTMRGTGDSQLLVGWSGSDGAHAPVYVRSKRDNTTSANWSEWAQIHTSASFNPANKVDTSRNINTSGSISGGGNLTADRTITHLTTSGHKHIPSGGASGQYLKWSADGTASWSALGLLVKGSYLTGGNYDGSTSTTWAVDATPNATANKVVARDGNGYSSFRSIRSELANQTGALTGVALAYRTTAADGHIRFTTDNAAVRNWLGLEGSLTSYVKKAGDTMTGDLTVSTKITTNDSLTTGTATFSNTIVATNGIRVSKNLAGTASANTYPEGLTTHISNDTANGYPGTYGAILNVNAGGYTRQFQMYTSPANNIIAIRNSHNSFAVEKGYWGDWKTIYHTEYKPTASDVGLGNVPNTAHTTAGTVNTVPVRDSAGDITSRLFRSSYQDETTMSGAIGFRISTSNNYMRYCSNPAAVRAWLNVENGLNAYVKKAGDTMSGELSISGQNININIPSTSGGHARGLVFKSSDGLSTLAAIGEHGGGASINSLHIGLGDNWWTTGLGIKVTRDNAFVNNNAIYHAGNKPTKADVGLSAVNNWGASSSINANSTTEYATTNMVKQVKDLIADSKQDVLNSCGILDAETGRATHRNGVYSYNTYYKTLGDSTPTQWWSTIAFGRGAGGSAQIAASWNNQGNELWFRSLRDTVDNWYSWKRIYHTGYKPSSTDVGLGNVNNWGASNDAGNNSATTYATTNMVHNRIGNVNNWGASSDINANSTSQYATTNMVAQVRNEKLTNPGYGGVHELGRYLDLHLSGSGADYDARIWTDGGQKVCMSGVLSISGRAMIDASKFSGGTGQQPAVSLAIGDNDTGFNWEGDGSISYWANNTRKYYMNNVWHSGNFNPGNLNNNRFSTRVVGIDYTGNDAMYEIHKPGVVAYGLSIISNNRFSFVQTNGGGGWVKTLFSTDTNGYTYSSRTYNAVWNDYAEYFPKEIGYETEPGDIIALSLHGCEEIYELATEDHLVIVGAHSDCYGHLIGGDEQPEGDTGTFEEYNSTKYIPVGLVGRLAVKFIGEAKKGMKVVPSHIPGVGREFNKEKDDYDKVIGYIVENNFEEGVRRVKIKIGK